MAVAGIKISASFPELTQLRQDLMAIADKRTNAASLGEALERAIWPMYLRLRETTPDGPTGNLKRAVKYKVKTYPRDGGAVGLVGYERAAIGQASSAAGGSVRAGPDRAFHQWFLEFGTKERKITRPARNEQYQRRSPTQAYMRTRMGQREVVRGNGVTHWVSGQGNNVYIASSYNKLGPFKIVGTGAQGRVETDPPYPRAFFRKSNRPIVIPPTPVGGSFGRPPVRTAFDDTQRQMAQILVSELRISLQRAIDALVVTDTGSITGAL